MTATRIARPNDSTSPGAACVSLVAHGSHYEMGVCQGRQLRFDIKACMDSCAQQEAFRQEQPWWMPHAAFFWLARMKAASLLEKPLAKDFPEMNQRLIGMADGCGLGRNTVYLMNAVEALMSSVATRTVVPSLAACSAIAVRGRRSATGEPIISRNFDYVDFVQPYYIVRENRPDCGYRSFDFTVATMTGAVDGMNEHGLCITYNYAYTTDGGVPSAPVSMLISEMLERCKSVDEAAQWLAGRPRWGGALLMLADATGDIAALEVSNTKTTVRRPSAGADLLFHTNQFNTSEMQSVQVHRDAVYNGRAHSALRNRRVLESAEKRSDRLDLLLRGFEQYTPERLAEIMADHGESGIPSDTTVCVHGAYQSTNACLQFLPASRRMRISCTSACEARFDEIQF